MSQTPPEPHEPVDPLKEPPAPEAAQPESPSPSIDEPGPALWLAKQDFLAPPVQAFAPAAPMEDPRPTLRRIGPGVLESFGWIGGAFLLQIIGTVVGGLVVAVMLMAGDSQESLSGPEQIEQSILQHGDVLFGVAQLLTVTGVVIAVALRLGRDRTRALSFRRINWRHVLILLLTMLPMGILSVQMFLIGKMAWAELVELVPALESLDSVSSMQAVEELSRNANPVLLVLAVAVGPAVWEELVFRGIIGRGLIARHGIPVGVIVTSLMFAVMHLNPAHVFALLPLSVFMHLSYLATRSFWAPMLVHFLNNGIAVTVLLSGSADAEAAGDTAELELAPFVFAAAVASVSAFLVLLWRTRVEFVTEEGLVWDPGYPTAESPPQDVPLRPVLTAAPSILWAVAVLGLILFVASWSTLVEPPPAP